MKRPSLLTNYVAIATGCLPAGLAFGPWISALQVPYYFTVALSIFVYSGTVQSAFPGYWAIGIEPYSTVVTAFLINLRHTFYGPHIQH